MQLLLRLPADEIRHLAVEPFCLHGRCPGRRCHVGEGWVRDDGEKRHKINQVLIKRNAGAVKETKSSAFGIYMPGESLLSSFRLIFYYDGFQSQFLKTPSGDSATSHQWSFF